MSEGRMPRAWARLIPERTPDVRAGREAPTTRAAEPLPSHTATASPASSGSARNRAARGKRGMNKQAIRVMSAERFETEKTTEAQRHREETLRKTSQTRRHEDTKDLSLM
jgi:hypothetical protein